MLSRKFIIAAIVAIVAPILLLLPWVWRSDNIIGLIYVPLPSLIGIIVGAFIYSRVRESCIGSVLSFLVSAVVTWIMIAFLIPQTAGVDAYPAATWALMFYLAIAGVTGLVFGSDVGQSGSNERQQ